MIHIRIVDSNHATEQTLASVSPFLISYYYNRYSIYYFFNQYSGYYMLCKKKKFVSLTSAFSAILVIYSIFNCVFLCSHFVYISSFSSSRGTLGWAGLLSSISSCSCSSSIFRDPPLQLPTKQSQNHLLFRHFFYPAFNLELSSNDCFHFYRD